MYYILHNFIVQRVFLGDDFKVARLEGTWLIALCGAGDLDLVVVLSIRVILVLRNLDLIFKSDHIGEQFTARPDGIN